MGISDKIEAFILELMKQEREEYLRIQRNELAEIFGCVPSQINYVISTRFSPERGYTVISRRGGGGCVMIRKAENDNGIGYEISERDAYAMIEKMAAQKKITEREARLMKCATGDISLGALADKNRARASILKNMLAVTTKEEV